MIDKIALEELINDLEFTVRASNSNKKYYEDALKKHPNQIQWLKVIGRAEGRIALAEQIIEKLNVLVGG